MTAIWRGEAQGAAGDVGPPAVRDSGPELVVGGQARASFRRAARFGDGWIMGRGTPDQLAEGAEATRSAWSEAGREGEPKIMALAYFALGDSAEEDANSELRHYYAWLGEERAGMIAQSAAKTDETVAQYVAAFEGAGCDELVFFPCSFKLDQVERLRAALS